MELNYVIKGLSCVYVFVYTPSILSFKTHLHVI